MGSVTNHTIQRWTTSVIPQALLSLWPWRSALRGVASMFPLPGPGRTPCLPQPRSDTVWLPRLGSVNAMSSCLILLGPGHHAGRWPLHRSHPWEAHSRGWAPSWQPAPPRQPSEKAPWKRVLWPPRPAFPAAELRPNCRFMNKIHDFSV